MFEGCTGCCIVLLLIPLACCALGVGGVVYVYSTAPDPPLGDNFKASQVEATEFNNQIVNATYQAASQGSFVLTFTERQLSSWMQFEGESFAEQNDHAFPFKDVQVGIRDGRMTFYGELDQAEGIKLPVEVVVEPIVNNEGQLEFVIDEAHMGGIRLPDFVLENVTGQLNDAIQKPLEDLPANYTLYPQTLSVGKDTPGTFAVQGYATP